MFPMSHPGMLERRSRANQLVGAETWAKKLFEPLYPTGKQNVKTWQTFCVLKTSEGGMGQKQAILLLKEKGYQARKGYSPYVGQSGVEVFITEKEIDIVSDILF